MPHETNRSLPSSHPYPFVSIWHHRWASGRADLMAVEGGRNLIFCQLMSDLLGSPPQAGKIGLSNFWRFHLGQRIKSNLSQSNGKSGRWVHCLCPGKKTSYGNVKRREQVGRGASPLGCVENCEPWVDGCICWGAWELFPVCALLLGLHSLP